MCTCSVDLEPVSTALCSVLVRARKEGRLVCGVYPCGKTLEMCLDDVMLCVLPESAADVDVTLRMHSILLESFCVENYVRVVKVDCANKLRHLLVTADDADVIKSRGLDCEVPASQDLADYQCLLVMVRAQC